MWCHISCTSRVFRQIKLSHLIIFLLISLYDIRQKQFITTRRFRYRLALSRCANGSRRKLSRPFAAHGKILMTLSRGEHLPMIESIPAARRGNAREKERER